MSDSSDSDSSSVSGGSGSSLSNLSEEIEVLRQLTNMEKIIEVEEPENKPEGDADLDILPYINLLVNYQQFQVDGLDENASTSSSDGFNSVIGSPSYCFSDSSAPSSSESPVATPREENLEEGECPPSPHTSHYESDSDIISLNASHQSISSDSATSASPEKEAEQRKKIINLNDSEASTSREEIPTIDLCSKDDSDTDILSLSTSHQSISSDSAMSVDVSSPKNDEQSEKTKKSYISKASTMRQDVTKLDAKDDSGPDLDVLSLSCSSLSSLSSRTYDSDLEE